MGGANKEYNWNPEDPSDSKEDDENDPSVKPGHRLLIKSAVLMPSAKVDEVTIVQIESEGYKKQKVEVPICAMTGGKDYQTYVDLLIPCPAKLTLLQGEGPINLVGSHCVDFYGYRDLGSGDDDEEDEATADEEAAEAEAMDEGNEIKKKTPTKEASAEKKTPTKDASAEKKTPSKEGSGEKRKASGDQQPKSGEKKKKESPAK